MSTRLAQKELEGQRILIAGAGGQVGTALQKTMPSAVEQLALDSKNLDITDTQAVEEIVTQFKPDWIINAAAYTAVDKAESEPEKAFSINRDGAANLALAATSVSARMVQISTDYVFEGTKASPYKPDDPVGPINVYGESKLAGEIATREILGEDLLILRTAWVYAPHRKNFLTTMLRLMQERDELKVVEDQIGTPTSASTLANTILHAIKHGVVGAHHWTDAGVASWYDFACAIGEYGRELGILDQRAHIVPIRTLDYPTPAKRPICSVLDKQSTRDLIGDNGLHWRDVLRDVLVDSITANVIQ
jgi:dTDP-4-dehydrorhamnose reductase